MKQRDYISSRFKKQYKLRSCIIFISGILYLLVLGKYSVSVDQSEINKLKLVLVIAPKPNFSNVPKSLLLWRNALTLSGGKVLLLLNLPSDRSVAAKAGFLVDYVRESHNGLPLLNSIIDATKKYDSAIVGFCNSDLEPSLHDVHTFFEYVLSESWAENWRKGETEILSSDPMPHSDAWLIVASRMDYQNNFTDKKPHKAGGVDFWLWNHAKLGILGLGESTPAFRLGRPLFDNWLTAMAIQLRQRHIIDATLPLNVMHKNHERLGQLSSWKNRTLRSSDEDWLQNTRLAKTRVCIQRLCSRYRGGIGTACEAPFYLENHMGSTNVYNYTQIYVRKRAAPMPCPRCNHCYVQLGEQKLASPY
mmetsp:Transcript_2861/g.10349  ORF Transcript_2861/g.10349 Transcript_2861/m.10349 type:complete len:362 (-) Transcript_2861:595-1680(-)